MGSTTIDSVRWPSPWRPIDDDYAALSFGRRFGNQPIADTVLGELRREICDEHPLYGRECTPVAFDADCPKEFLFLTDIPDAPVVLVHFTWHTEPKPDFPSIKRYASVQDFMRQERRYRKKWWQLWVW